MERHQRKRSKSKPTKASVSLPLMRVDGSRIRQQIKREYEKIVQDLEKARAELDRFEKEDLPKFTQWLNSQFGALMTELRDTTRRIHELEQLLLEMQSEIFFNGASPRRAYARVMNRRENSASEEADEGEEQFGQGNGAANGQASDSEGFEGAGAGFDDYSPPGRGRAARPARESLAAPALGRLKELYRALARRLHPDAQKEMTAQKKEWWHQAQVAYEKGDLQQLEIILSLCEIDETGTTDKTSLSVIQRISAQLKKSLRRVKAQLSKYRRDPAWNFKGRKDIKILAVTMRRQLTNDLEMMKQQVKAMELQMADWASQPEPRRSRRSRPVFDPFEFLF